MKLHGIKLVWAAGLILVVSAAVFHRLANSLDKSAAQPQLATLASLYKSSDPRALTTAFKLETKVEPTAAAAPGTIDFSPYVRLHVTRADNLVAHDGID